MSEGPTSFAAESKPAILYVEDDENDVLFMQKGCKLSGLGCALRIATNGQQAIDYLVGTGPFGDREQNPLPCLVLLDLNLPFKNGFEVLSWIRSQEHLQNLPVIIYSASAQERDRQQAADLGANEYCAKLPTPNQIAGLLKRLYERWLAPETAETHNPPDVRSRSKTSSRKES